MLLWSDGGTKVEMMELFCLKMTYSQCTTVTAYYAYVDKDTGHSERVLFQP